MSRTALSLRTLAVSCASLGAVLALQAPAVAEQAGTPRSDLKLTMQEQQKDQWCWAASGNSVADFWGYQISQTEFCQVAHNESGQDCANEQGYLSDQQRVYDHLGFSDTGSYNDNGETLNFAGIKSEIDAGRPIGTRIGWTSGGGHMHVVHGYSDSNGGTVSYGDPWPDSNRYNSMDYDAYLNNGDFQWTHTVYGVKG